VGICGRKMTVQKPRSERETDRLVTFVQSSFGSGEADTICQSMTSRPVDGAIVEAFLESVSPMSLEVGLRVLEQLEQDLAVQRRQRELQLEQARYEARLAQRQYDAVDPDNRLVASELERRWNEKLERVTHLEQAYAQAEQEAEWNLTPEERQAIQELSQNLPRLWKAPSTTNQERKRLLRMAIESVQLDGMSKPGEIDVQIRWRSGVLTNFSVHRTRAGGSVSQDARGGCSQDSRNGRPVHLQGYCRSSECPPVTGRRSGDFLHTTACGLYLQT